MGDICEYAGEWANNRKHGEGVLTFSDGKKLRGLFSDGKYLTPTGPDQNEK